QTVFKLHEAGGIATRVRQTSDKARSNWVGDNREYDRHGPSRLKHLLYCAASDQNDVRREGGQFRRIFAYVVGIARTPTRFDLHITTIGPAQLPQLLLERRMAGLRIRIVRGQTVKHSDAPHALGLLRLRREWPRNRCATNK